MAWRNTWTAIREPVLQTLAPVSPSPDQPWTRRTLALFVRAVHKFWEHGDLFSSAAISFYALFSLLPLVILFLVSMQMFVPYDTLRRNLGRLFGLTESDVVLQTVQNAYAHQATLGWVGVITLIIAAAGVFGALQVGLDRIWESRGRMMHLRFLVGVLTMAASLLIFVAMLIGTVYVFRFIRTSVVGEWLGWPRTPPRGSGQVLSIAAALAQFGIFWTGYRFLPNVPVRWRDALPGALVAAVVWHALGYVLGWYLGTVADYSTLYHQLAIIVALLVWVYGLSASFLLGAEFVAQRTLWPLGGGDPRWRQPVQAPAAQGPPPKR